jgi:hypothetical protein
MRKTSWIRTRARTRDTTRTPPITLDLDKSFQFTGPELSGFGKLQSTRSTFNFGFKSFPRPSAVSLIFQEIHGRPSQLLSHHESQTANMFRLREEEDQVLEDNTLQQLREEVSGKSWFPLSTVL